MVTAWGVHLNVVRNLGEAGCAIDIRYGVIGNPLMMACGKGQKYIVSYLLGAGADVSIRDHINNTALIYAVRSEDIEVVKLILCCPVDVNSRNFACNIAIEWARGHESNDIAAHLIALWAIN